jgi:hypothetical protein
MEQYMKKEANPSLSPAVQNAQMDMMGQPQNVDRETLFNELFTDKAYQNFTTKYSELMPYLVGFKVIKSDAETGSAIGTFFLTFNPNQPES